jgi:hypothetical protein
MAQSIFIPKATTADLASLDYFTPKDAVYPAGTGCVPAAVNKHPLINFPATLGSDNAIFFEGVMGTDWGESLIALDIYWVSPVTVGDVVWFVSWERDNALPFGVDLAVDSYGSEKALVAPAPPAYAQIRKSSVVFTQAQADDLAAGDPFRLRIRRDGGSLLDTLAGDAQLFRVYYEGTP